MVNKSKAHIPMAAAIGAAIVMLIVVSILVWNQLQTKSTSTAGQVDKVPATIGSDTGLEVSPSMHRASRKSDPSSSGVESEVVTDSARPGSFSESLQVYTDEEQRKIIQFSDDHFGALEFSNAEQLAWMRRHGYPDPEDILEAEYLSFEDLQGRADAGDPVAMSLASARALKLMLEEANSILEQQGKGELLFSPEYWKYERAARRYARELTRTGWPFGAFLSARLQFERSLLFQGDRLTADSLRSAALTSLNLMYMAELMGDDRVGVLAREFAQSAGVPYSDLQLIELAYGTIRATQTGIDCSVLFGNDRIPDP